MSDAYILNRTIRTVPVKKKKVKNKQKISQDDFDLINILEDLKFELNNLHNCLDNITDPVLIDSYIFEIQAINMRYKFYLRRCKEKGIVANI